MGWFLRDPEGDKHYGTWKFPSGEPDGHRLLKLYQRLYGLVEQHDMLDADLRVAMEAPAFTKNPHSQTLPREMVGTVRLFCATYGFLPPKILTVTEWRPAFLKVGGFLPKSTPPKSVQDRTAWYKGKTIEQCNRMGFNPENDNEADAIGIGWWLYKGGPDRQAANREEKKRKKREKAEAEEARKELLAQQPELL
jgi:hypothetical protein